MLNESPNLRESCHVMFYCLHGDQSYAVPQDCCSKVLMVIAKERTDSP